MIIEMETQSHIVGKYSDRVVFLVSHVDTSDDPTTTISDVYKEMERRKMKQQVIFYSNTYSDSVRLSKALFLTATNYPEAKLEISKEEFQEKFMIGRSYDKFKTQS